MEYIEITDWSKFQHYAKRNPPWIKLYSWFLDDDDFDCLPDASKLLFFCLLSFASRRNNRVKLDYKWLQKKLPVQKKITEKTLQPLIDVGFISKHQGDDEPLDASKPLEHDASLSKAKEEKRDILKSKEEGTLDFSLTFGFFKNLFDEYFKPETQYEINTFNKLARKCFKYAKERQLNKFGSWMIETLADSKEYCKTNGKNRTELIKIATANINKGMK